MILNLDVFREHVYAYRYGLGQRQHQQQHRHHDATIQQSVLPRRHSSEGRYL
jgi:hypothetical protein